MSINRNKLNLKEMKNDCPLCQEGRECGFKFPTVLDFEKEGLFEDIKFPLLEYRPLPDNLLKYIYPANWNEKYDHVPFHSVYLIKRYLNTLMYKK